ncbi:unnamed protein product [Parajaminaea phylloscopi]
MVHLDTSGSSIANPGSPEQRRPFLPRGRLAPCPPTTLHRFAAGRPPFRSCAILSLIRQQLVSASPSRMITDVQLSALANWLGSLTMILIVLYHAVGANAKRTDDTTARAMAGEATQP